MTIPDEIHRLLADKDRADLEPLGRVQTGGPMTDLDFEQIALTLVERLLVVIDEIPDRTMVAEQLRQVWNARGAADVEAVRKNIDIYMAIKAQDR